MSKEYVVSVRGLRKKYILNSRPVEILVDTTLDVESGKFIGLVGPSGSGKSTLLHILAGLVRADAGSVSVCGRDMIKATTDEILDMRRKELGYVFQDFRLLTRLTAVENVMLPLLAAKVPSQAARKAAHDKLEQLGLKERSFHFPRQLSGGEQQRVALARALVTRPKVVLADEPTGNLDQKNAEDVIALLASLPAQFKTTILLVTHNMAFLDHTDAGYRLVNGRLEAM